MQGLSRLLKKLDLATTRIQIKLLREQRQHLAARCVACAPEKLKPYLKLARFDRPTGILLIFWPCCWGIGSGTTAGCLPDPYMLTLFAAGSVTMRCVACIINDIQDRDIDSQVARTKCRPLVTGELTILEACAFLFGHLCLALTILLQLNWYTVYLGGSSLLLAFVYPQMKKLTHFPQIMLGLASSWGVLLGYSSLQGELNFSVCLPLFTAGICWSVIYDTIYSHQDKVDDIKVGVKSTALYFGANTKAWLTGISCCMIGNLVTSGIMNDQTWPYYSSIIMISTHLARQITTLHYDDPDDCMKKFKSNSTIGIIIAGGIVFGTLLKGERN